MRGVWWEKGGGRGGGVGGWGGRNGAGRGGGGVGESALSLNVDKFDPDTE